MKIYGNESNEKLLEELRDRIKARRIAMSISQEELALESGVSLRTITNLEKGSNVSLSSLISVLRVLRIIENLDVLVPEDKINPFDLIKLDNGRKKVSKKKNNNSTWKWGDEK